MNSNRYLTVIILALLFLVESNTVNPVEAAGSLSDTSVSFVVPGYEQAQVTAGFSEWDASQMKLAIKTEYPFDNLYNGYLFYTFCLDNKSFADGSYAMELLIDEYWGSSEISARTFEFTALDGKLSFNTDNLFSSILGDKTYITIRTDYYFENGYPEKTGVLKFTIITHSSLAKAAGKIALSDITVLDSVNGCFDLDLSKCLYKCEKYNPAKNTYSDWSFTVEKNGRKTDVSKNSIEPIYKKKTGSASTSHDGIKFNVTEGKVSSTLSITAPCSAETLYSGKFAVWLGFNKSDLTSGDFNLMFKVQNSGNTLAEGFQNIKIDESGMVPFGCALPLSVRNDKIYMLCTFDYSEENGYKITDKSLTLEVNINNTQGTALKDVFITGFTVNDSVSGLSKLNLANSNIRYNLDLATPGSTNPVTSKDTFGHRLYVTNQPEYLSVGDQVTLNVISELYNKLSLTYESSDKAVAEISKTGQVKALKEGKTVITVTDTQSKSSYSFELVVLGPHLELISEKTKLFEGQKYYCAVLAKAFTAKKLTWKSSDTKVGTIDAKTGLFTAKKAGTTTITVSDNGNYPLSFQMTVEKSTINLNDYITIESHPDVSKKNTQIVYDHIKKVYNQVMGSFGSEGYTPYVHIKFDHISLDEAAFASYSYDYDYGVHWDITVGVHVFSLGMDITNTLTHELTHVAQNYMDERAADGSDVTNISEGLANIGAYVNYVDKTHINSLLRPYSRVNHYFDGYEITAGFINYICENYYPAFYQCLNETVRRNKYSSDVYKELTGYTPEELWTRFGKWSVVNQW